MSEKRFKSRCYEKQKNVVIYDKSDKLFDVSYRDFEDAYYLKMKLSPVIDKLNELSNQNNELETVLQELINQLYNAQSSLIHEYSTDIVNDEKELKKYFQDQYGKYGWKK
ncbi:MAG: hypothetical protein IJ258_05125 [Methanobrevibacter sp.]|uniref:hypothetical protein n=1 Tax=Methanobrevibacter sp. TaxID=66852 RepID=UPI0025FE2AA8|nr:hypothetical protein [Methanobrevibacter sp.]MBQ8017471.1 hypothetical protein [Methanobrevibacter sp.]